MIDTLTEAFPDFCLDVAARSCSTLFLAMFSMKLEVMYAFQLNCLFYLHFEIEVLTASDSFPLPSDWLENLTLLHSNFKCMFPCFSVLYIESVISCLSS